VVVPDTGIASQGPAIDDIFSNNNSKTMVAAAGPTDSIPYGPRHRCLAVKVVATAEPTGSTPRGGPPSTASLTSVVATIGSTTSTLQGAHHRHLLQLWWWPLPNPPAACPRGPVINAFYNFSGGPSRIHQQHPRGAHDRRLLQLHWWPLPDPLAAPPRGPPSMSSIISLVATTRSAGSTPRGPTINVLYNFGGGHC
jgi:hypothetical protein